MSLTSHFVLSSQTTDCLKIIDGSAPLPLEGHSAEVISEDVSYDSSWTALTSACREGNLPLAESLLKEGAVILQRDYRYLVPLLAKAAGSDVANINQKWTEILKQVRGDGENEKQLFKSLVSFMYDGDWEGSDSGLEFIKVGLLQLRTVASSKKLRKKIKHVKSLFKASISSKEDLGYIFKALAKSKRVAFLTDFISFSNWSVNTEQKEFIVEKLDRLKKAPLTAEGASKAHQLLTSIQSACLYNQEHSQRIEVKRDAIAIESCTNIKKLDRLIAVAKAWRKRAKEAYLVAKARAVGLSKNQKMRLRDSKRVIKMIQLELEHIEKNKLCQLGTRRDIFAAISNRRKFLGIAISKTHLESHETELLYLAANPDNLNIIKERNSTSSGVGISLVKHLATTAQKRGHSRLYLRATESAAPWYIQKFGFRKVLPKDLSEEPLLEIGEKEIATLVLE